MIFERSTREQSLANIRQALSEECGWEAYYDHRAEMLAAIADDHAIEPDEVVNWIHYRAPEKCWSVPEFVRWAGKYAEARRQLEELQRHNDEEYAKICQQCWSAVALRRGPRWWCPMCGDV